MKTVIIIVAILSAIAAFIYMTQDSTIDHDLYLAGQQAGWERMNADRNAKGLSIKEYQQTAYYKDVLQPAWDSLTSNGGKF